MKKCRRDWMVAAAVVLALNTGLLADVLVLRDGRRIEGTLVGVRGDSVEFEHTVGREEGREEGRVRRYDRDEVRSILFDDDRPTNRGRFDAGSRTGLRERSVTVDARTPWSDSGVEVRAGQDVIFASTGQVRWGPNRRDGAGGERNSPRNAGRPMPDRNAAALIGRIGPNGDPFFIGEDQGAIRMRGSGRLYLGLNDDFLQDNSGVLRVIISY